MRLAVGLPLTLVAVFALAVTILHARQARDFERRASVGSGQVIEASSDEQSWMQHVVVELIVDGRTVTGRAPVLDPQRYRVGEEVEVLYDPDRPERILLDEERYDAASPGLLWSAVLVGGLLPMAMGWWWVRRLRRTAAANAPTFAMGVTVEQARPRWWNVRRPWVTLFPLDGPDARAVGRYPLMSGVVLGDTGTTAEVKGQVRDGGLVVARPAGSDAGAVLWPRGRLRADAPTHS